MLVTIHNCLRCGEVHFDLQVYKLNERYYAKCPKTNKMLIIAYK